MEDMRKIPVVALRGMTILTGMVVHFDMSREASAKAVEEAMMKDQKIFVVTQRELEENNPAKEDLFDIGTVAEVKQIIKLPKGLLRVLVEGIERAELLDLDMSLPFREGTIAFFEDDSMESVSEIEQEAMVRSLQEALADFGIGSGKLAKEALTQLLDIHDLTRLVDQSTATVPLYYDEQQLLLDAITVRDRFDVLITLLTREAKVQQYKAEIQKKVHERLDKNQREYVLREQLRVIREELGDDTTLTDAENFAQAIESLKAPKEVKDKLRKELNRFKSGGNNNTAEMGVIRTYLETMLEMPWEKLSRDNKDLKRAAEILDEDHYGLKEVKERVLEFLAVRILTKKGESPILCLVGPPGTGKTSIAKSIARTLGRKYVRISLGGVRDEAEIRGHRKTYVGAMPGRIANGLSLAGTRNPLMLLDEIDKVSTDYKGDTFSALLEVLDSEQNHRFRDHYLEVPLDLSEVLFVTTANTTDTIPRPLLDRMEVIHISSYTENEKAHIAQEHLLPKQREHHGIKEEGLLISQTALEHMIRFYTKEAGVRQLERKIGEICRKSARIFLEEHKESVHVTERNLERFLGKPLYRYQMANPTDEIGIVRGLAWTQVGGDTLQIEVNVMEGKGELLLTGQLGDVMKESARAGISYIRSVAETYGIRSEFFREHDIHVHIPEGAVPKDGPSAGITMATAILSAAARRKVRADVAMTGEITLRGRVLAIGGLKEKLLAAKNAGIKTVLVPEENRRDVEEISKEITKGLTIRYVETMEEVLSEALV